MHSKHLFAGISYTAYLIFILQFGEIIQCTNISDKVRLFYFGNIHFL